MMSSADVAVMTEEDEIYFLALVRAHSVAVVLTNGSCERCVVMKRVCEELRISFYMITEFNYSYWVDIAASILPKKLSSL